MKLKEMVLLEKELKELNAITGNINSYNTESDLITIFTDKDEELELYNTSRNGKLQEIINNMNVEDIVSRIEDIYGIEIDVKKLISSIDDDYFPTSFGLVRI